MVRSKEPAEVGEQAGARECVYHILNCKSKQKQGQCSFGLIVRYITILENRPSHKSNRVFKPIPANNLRYYV